MTKKKKKKKRAHPITVEHNILFIPRYYTVCVYECWATRHCGSNVHGQWRMQCFWMSYGAFTTCPHGPCDIMACSVLFLKIGIVERRFAGVFLNRALIDANVPRKTLSYHYWTVDIKTHDIMFTLLEVMGGGKARETSPKVVPLIPPPNVWRQNITNCILLCY